jgi:hypothetical protein
MRKFWGIWGLAAVAGIAIWSMTARVPVAVVGLPQLPATGIDPRFFVLVIVAMTAIAFAFARAWRYERRLKRDDERADDQLSSSTSERLARIEQTLEAVALEVERIGEMERFATKLLNARQSEIDARVPSTPQRVITPH